MEFKTSGLARRISNESGIKMTDVWDILDELNVKPGVFTNDEYKKLYQKVTYKNYLKLSN